MKRADELRFALPKLHLHASPRTTGPGRMETECSFVIDLFADTLGLSGSHMRLFNSTAGSFVLCTAVVWLVPIDDGLITGLAGSKKSLLRENGVGLGIGSMLLKIKIQCNLVFI